jgi:tetratricopeptide (TPR) repeat protein
LLVFITQREAAGQKDASLAAFYTLLARAYKHENQIDRAISTWQKALNLQEKLNLVLEFATSLKELGTLYDYQGKYSKVKPLYLQDSHPITEITNNLQGANIANFANEVKDNARLQATLYIYKDPNQNLTVAAKEIKALLAQLDKDYDRNTPIGQVMINAKAIEAIVENPNLKSRITNAIKESSATALEVLVDHPAIKILVAALKGFTDSK